MKTKPVEPENIQDILMKITAEQTEQPSEYESIAQQFNEKRQQEQINTDHEAARARINMEMALKSLNLALCWARRTGNMHAEIHGLSAITRLVLKEMRKVGGAQIRNNPKGESEDANVSRDVSE